MVSIYFAAWRPQHAELHDKSELTVEGLFAQHEDEITLIEATMFDDQLFVTWKTRLSCLCQSARCVVLFTAPSKHPRLQSSAGFGATM